MPTRLYFHNTQDDTSGLPTAEQSSLTADQSAEAQTINRSMNDTIGSGQTYIRQLSIGTTGTRYYYYTRFVSPPLYQTSIAPNTWTYSFAARSTTGSANFPVSGTDKPVRINVYVWRPSTQTKIGTILDGNTASTVDEGGANVERASTTTFSGSGVSSIVAGDVIIIEIWFIIAQSFTNQYYDDFFYDGTTVTTTDGTVSNHASFLETPEIINFQAGSGGITMTEVAALTYANKSIDKAPIYIPFLDYWGIAKMFPTKSGGREYKAPLDVGTWRQFTSGNRDPQYPNDDMRAIGAATTYTVDPSTQTIQVDAPTPGSSYPRLYFYDIDRALSWENVEITAYYKWGTGSGYPSYSGMEMGVRGRHELQTGADYVRTYYTRHGKGNLVWYRMKEEIHPSSNDVSVQTGISFNDGVWYGMKMVIQTITSSGYARLRSYRDVTDGFNGGTWNQMSDFTDTGSNWSGNGGGPHPVYKAGETYCDDHVFFLRQDAGINGYLMKKISCREIDPLP